MKVYNYSRGSSYLSYRYAVFSDQAVVKNHGSPSLLISFLEQSKEGEDDRSTDSIESRALLTSIEVVVTPDIVRGT